VYIVCLLLVAMMVCNRGNRILSFSWPRNWSSCSLYIVEASIVRYLNTLWWDPMVKIHVPTCRCFHLLSVYNYLWYLVSVNNYVSSLPLLALCTMTRSMSLCLWYWLLKLVKSHLHFNLTGFSGKKCYVAVCSVRLYQEWWFSMVKCFQTTTCYQLLH